MTTTNPGTSTSTDFAGRVTCVADATGACLERLRPAAFTDLAAGRLGVAARPGMRRVGWLASDILSALGCDQTVSGAGRPGEADRDTTVAWLLTHRVRHLYVQFAWNISYPALLAAVDIAERARVHLWLVGDGGYSDHHTTLLAPYTPQEWTETEFLAHWQHLTQPAEPAGTTVAPAVGPSGTCGVGWPMRLPDDDFTTFRAACRDRLRPEEFKLVDEYFLDRHDHARTALLPLVESPNEMTGSLVSVEAAVADWLSGRWEDAETLQHFLVTVRAAQVAAFGAGFFVQVDLDHLIGTASTRPRRAQRNPDTWARLCAYAQPYRSAACALAATGLGVDPMVTLPVSCFDPGTGVVTDNGGRTFLVEPGARIFVEAQQTLRRINGAADSDLLLVNPSTGDPFRPRAIASTIRAVRREVGAAVALPEPERANPDSEFWFRRFGISVKELA